MIPPPVPFRNLLAQVEFSISKNRQSEERLAATWLEFASEVKRYRKDHKISLGKLAKRLGISKSLLSYLETGQRTWTIEMARKVVAELEGR